MGNPPKKLTPKELEEIETMAGLGIRFEDIAKIKGICDDTLKKYAKEQLERGRAKAKATVMHTAYKMAISGRVPSMTMFWLKTQAGWRENKKDHGENTRFEIVLNRIPEKPVEEMTYEEKIAEIHQIANGI